MSQDTLRACAARLTRSARSHVAAIACYRACAELFVEFINDMKTLSLNEFIAEKNIDLRVSSVNMLTMVTMVTRCRC